MDKNKHKVSLNLFFGSSLRLFKVKRSQANWPTAARARMRSAQLAGGLKVFISQTEEKNKISK